MTQLINRQLEVLQQAGTMPSHVAPVESAAAHSAPEVSAPPPAAVPPVHPAAAIGLTPSRSPIRPLYAALCFTAKKSKNLTQQYRSKLAFGAQWKELVYPTVTEHSRGSRLWDLNGNEYIDIVNGFGSTVFGHARDFVVNVVRSQLDRGFEIGPQSPSAGRVAAMLCDTTGMERATICNTGSEAVMACIRVARCVTGRSRIVTFSGAYHSIFDEVLATGIQKADGPRTVLEYASASSLRWIEEHAKELAGVLVEPVQSRHSDLQPKEFLHELRCITKKSGCALIFDEGTTGFRVHPGGVQAIFDIRPTLRRTEKCWAAACRLAHSPGVRSSWMPWTGATGAMATTLLRIEASLSLVGRLSAILYPLRPPSRLRPFAETGPGPAGKAERDDGPACGGTELLFQRGRFASLLFYHLRANGVYMREGYPCFLTSAHTEGDVNNIAEICSIDR